MGKYAIINLRTNKIEYGTENPGNQFFVMKYKDRFTHAGLTGYANAIETYLKTAGNRVSERERAELEEYLADIRLEAAIACSLGSDTPT